MGSGLLKIVVIEAAIVAVVVELDVVEWFAADLSCTPQSLYLACSVSGAKLLVGEWILTLDPKNQNKSCFFLFQTSFNPLVPVGHFWNRGFVWMSNNTKIYSFRYFYSLQRVGMEFNSKHTFWLNSICFGKIKNFL